MRRGKRQRPDGGAAERSPATGGGAPTTGSGRGDGRRERGARAGCGIGRAYQGQIWVLAGPRRWGGAGRTRDDVVPSHWLRAAAPLMWRLAVGGATSGGDRVAWCKNDEVGG